MTTFEKYHDMWSNSWLVFYAISLRPLNGVTQKGLWCRIRYNVLLTLVLCLILVLYVVLAPFCLTYFKLTEDNHAHYHKEPDGFFVKCYHHCKSVVASPGFWIGVTLSFPLEHYLWEKVWPFYVISHWLGL